MEYLALSYPGESVIRLIEPRTVHPDLPGSAGRRGERAPPGDRLTLIHDNKEKKAAAEEVDGFPTVKPLNASRIYVIQAGSKDIRGSPVYEARLAYQRARMLGESEASHYLDIRV